MTLAQLRSFLAVAATGSVRAAAERLVVTQPAVSAAISALARDVGVPLFERDGRGLRLSSGGEAFAVHARHALGLLDEAVLAARGEADAERGRVRLAAVTTAGERLVPPLLAGFRELHPGIEVRLEVGNRQRVWELLAHHEVDLAIGGRPPGVHPFATLATRGHRLVVAARGPGVGVPGSASRQEMQRQVSLADLAAATWLLREPGSGTRATTEEFLRDIDLAPAVLTLGSNGAILEALRIGLGVTLISGDAITPELVAGTLQEWRYGPLPLERQWHVVARRDQPPTAPTRLFLDHALACGWGPA